MLWATDADAEWRGRVRPPGRYRVIAWIPPNLLTYGAMTVTAGVSSFVPRVEHFLEVDAVRFQAVDPLGAGTTRGDFTGYIGRLHDRNCNGPGVRGGNGRREFRRTVRAPVVPSRSDFTPLPAVGDGSPRSSSGPSEVCVGDGGAAQHQGMLRSR